MNLKRKYALEWPFVPDWEAEAGNRSTEAGRLASDHFEQIRIYDSWGDANRALAEMASDRLSAAEEVCEWLMVPDNAVVVPTDRFGDFAFIGARSSCVYLDSAYIAIFRLIAAKPEAEPAPALIQLEEHLIATVSEPGDEEKQHWQVIERQLTELADRIALAYRCDIEWLDIDRP